MQQFNYSLDPVTFEIFPLSISSNPLILFHGTSSYYSNEIEANGLQADKCPYNIQQAKSLVDTLQSSHFSAFDKSISYGLFSRTAAQSIEDYIGIIESGESKISLAALSSASVQYTLGNRKGGQAWGAIRNAKAVIDNALQSNSALIEHIPEDAKSILDAVSQFDTFPGVIYAIRVPKDLNGLTMSSMFYTVYSENDIQINDIVGKVVIPSSVNAGSFNGTDVDSKLKQKITQAGSIWAMLVRKEEAEKDLNETEDNATW